MFEDTLLFTFVPLCVFELLLKWSFGGVSSRTWDFFCIVFLHLMFQNLNLVVHHLKNIAVMGKSKTPVFLARRLARECYLELKES